MILWPKHVRINVHIFIQHFYLCLFTHLLILSNGNSYNRQGSGSACRSLYGGFVKWAMGNVRIMLSFSFFLFKCLVAPAYCLYYCLLRLSKHSIYRCICDLLPIKSVQVMWCQTINKCWLSYCCQWTCLNMIIVIYCQAYKTWMHLFNSSPILR